LFKPAGSRATKKKIPPGHIPPPPISLAPQTHVPYNFPWLFIFSFYRRVPKLARAHIPKEKKKRENNKTWKNIIFLSPISSNLFFFSCVIFPASNGNKTDCGLALCLSLRVCINIETFIYQEIRGGKKEEDGRVLWSWHEDTNNTFFQ
jgi:hypothetical protein